MAEMLPKWTYLVPEEAFGFHTVRKAAEIL